MVNTYKIYEDQNWADVSNHIYGKPDYSFELALLNSSAITAEVPAGMVIVYQDHSKEELVLKSLNGIPATAITAAPGAEPEPEGIGYWIIGQNFKVN